MVTGLFWMIIAHGAALLGTHAAWRRVRTSNDGVDALLFVLIHLLVVSTAILVAGLSGGLEARTLGLAGLALGAGLLAAREHRRIQWPRLPELRRPTALLIALLVGRMLLQVVLLAPHGGDVLSYHLPKIAEWVQAGRFTREMGLDTAVTFPAGFELVETWWVVFLHHDVLIEMAGVEMAILGFLAVRLLALEAGCDLGTSWLAAALYLACPVFTMQATTCYNDAPVASLILAMAALVSVRAHPTLLLLPLLLGTGIKGTFLYALPGWALLAIDRRGRPLLCPASNRWAGSLAVAATVAGLFWYARNLLWFGNPVFPITSQGYTWSGVTIQAGPRLSSLAANVSSLVSEFIYDKATIEPLTVRTAGWGVIAFGPGTVGLVLGAREDRGYRVLAAAFLVALAGVLLMVQPDDWCLRFALFFPAILYIGAARLASRLRPVALLVGVGVAVQFASTLLPQELDPASMSALLAQPWQERSLASMCGASGLPPGEPVAVAALGRVREYVLYGPDFSRRVIHLRVEDPEAVREEMIRRGVRYVYIDVDPRWETQIGIMERIGEFTRLSDRLYRLN